MLSAVMLTVMPLVAMAFSTWDGASAAPWTKGSGAASSPYIIETAEQLAYLAQHVNAGTTYIGKYFKMAADIDLNGKIDTDDAVNLMLYLDKIGLKPSDMGRYQYERTKEFLDRKKKYATDENLLGDVDNSGKVNAIDSSLVLDYYSQASTGQGVQFDDAQKKAADVNIDGSINAVDASLILSYYSYTATSNGDVMTLEEYLQR